MHINLSSIYVTFICVWLSELGRLGKEPWYALSVVQRVQTYFQQQISGQ